MIKNKNLIPRILLVLIALIPIVYFPAFYQHFYAYLTGNVITNLITRQWHIVLLSILVFCAFLIPLSFRRKAKWGEYGLVTAFFVSLFVEMYGIPLSLIFASKYFFTQNMMPPNVIEFTLFGVGFGMDIPMTYGAFLMILGTVLIAFAWVTLYKQSKKAGLVTHGIYAFSRHPQYLGFILVIIGWFMGWPTILTVIFSPILIYKYIRVCQTEEKEMEKLFPEYAAFKKSVPFFV